MTNSVTDLSVLLHKLNNDVSWSTDIPIGRLLQAILTPNVFSRLSIEVCLPDMTSQRGTALSILNDTGSGPTISCRVA